MNKSKGLSLQQKLFLILIFLPATSLGLYLWLATTVFKSDKLAYVFDSMTSHNRSLANQVKTEILVLQSALRPIVAGFDPKKEAFDDLAKKLFELDPVVNSLVVMRKDAQNAFKVISKLERDKPIDSNRIQDLARQVSDRDIAIRMADKTSSDPKLEFAVKFAQSAQDNDPIVVAGLARGARLAEAFNQTGLYSSYLISQRGEVIGGPAKSPIESFSNWPIFLDIQRASMPDMTSETTSPEQKPLLASFSKIDNGNMTAITITQKSDALSAVNILLSKSVVFFTALVSGSILLSVFVSRKLTSALRALSQATTQVASGNFDVQIEVKSNDEVGSLAQNFNQMASEVSRLLSETQEKARMESELKTAQMVQETLFPPNKFQTSSVELMGFYKPASECGGDWWHYCTVGKYLILWIGDVTGHGAASALLTSAAKSVASLLEAQAIHTPSEILRYLNHSIYQTSKGELMMTFFVAALDQETGELTYSNASHNPPIVVPFKNGPVQKKDLKSLVGSNHPRLGEKMNAADNKQEYKQSTMKLSPGDTIFFYTDGVTEMKNGSDELFGKQRWLNSILNAIKDNASADAAVERIQNDLENFGQDAPLADDITFAVCRFNKNLEQV